MKSDKKNKSIIEKLFENPITFLAGVYPYFLILFTAVGLFFIGNNNFLFQNKVTPALPDSTIQKVDLELMEPKISSAVDLNIISSPSQDFINKGKDLFMNTCASCHGNDGKGDGPAGLVLNPKPRNFHDETGWKFGRSFTNMFNTIKNGIITSGMAPYDYMPAEDRIAIIQYVRTFMTNPPEITNSEISELDQTYKLSEGVKQPGQIPISSAIQLVSNDYNNQYSKVKQLKDKIISSKDDNYVYYLFDEVTSNKERALTTLINSNDWKNSEDAFLRIVTNNIEQNGFNSKIISLSSYELQSLYNFLKSII